MQRFTRVVSDGSCGELGAVVNLVSVKALTDYI